MTRNPTGPTSKTTDKQYRDALAADTDDKKYGIRRGEKYWGARMAAVEAKLTAETAAE